MKPSTALKEVERGRLKSVLEDAALITDDLGLALIGKLVGPHTPIMASELPIGKFSSNLSLARLHTLEDKGIVKSKMIKKANGLERRFEITAFGKELAKKLPVKLV